MYRLKAGFNTLNETPTYPLISFGLKLHKTKEDREIFLKSLPSKEKLKNIIKKHYKKHNGKINGFGKIQYYELYKDDNLLYKLDICGNIIKNYKFLDLIIDFYLSKHNNSKEFLKKELICIQDFEEDYIELFDKIKRIVNEVDPFNIAYIYDDNEYEPEVRDLTIRLIGKNLNKIKIFKKTKAVFEEWFYKSEDKIEKYWQIADKIFRFYIDKKKNNLWKRI
jgi:hypothetical protein